jgi:hypothetical protein
MMAYPTFMAADNHLPATRALDRAQQSLSQAQHGLVLPKAGSALPRHESMITKNSLKRSRSAMGSFKLDDLLQATAPVEESIDFPCIEWNFNDDDEDAGDSKDHSNDFPSIGFPSFLGPSKVLPPFERAEDDEDDEEDDCCHRAKRVCKGLVRSKKVEANLASLADLLSGT